MSYQTFETEGPSLILLGCRKDTIMFKYKADLILTMLLAHLVCVFVCFISLKHKCPRGTFSRGAVAADTKICSETGRDILKQGGSAVDAAIAVLLCTSILNPQSEGLGGGSIFTVMDSSGKVKIISSRETVPSNVSPNLLNLCPFNVSIASKWIGVPGEIRGYEKVHKLYGKIPWAALFQPTIKMAREGINIPPIQASFIQTIKHTYKTRNLWKLFSDENGKLLKTGDTVKFEKLADTLETIANEGAESFYTGKIAEDLVRDVQEAGGLLTLQDLASYNVSVTDAWTVPLGEYQMFIPPPPAGGALLSFVLNIMKGYRMNSAPQTIYEKTLFYHRYIEAFKFAKGLKRHIRDPRFYSDETAENFTKDSFANNIQNLITDETHDLEYYNIIPYADSVGTSHVSVLAEDGSAVSVTSSINDPFGSRIYSPSTGVILNNQLADFCGKAKSIIPGERPPSSMAPAILKSQSKILVIGGSGGGFITAGMASALINHLWFGMSLKEAIAAPVLYVHSLSNEVKFESRFDEKALTILLSRGHDLQKFYNVVNAVEKEGNCICAVSDARKHGKAAGY